MATQEDIKITVCPRNLDTLKEDSIIKIKKIRLHQGEGNLESTPVLYCLEYKRRSMLPCPYI